MHAAFTAVPQMEAVVAKRHSTQRHIGGRAQWNAVASLSSKSHDYYYFLVFPRFLRICTFFQSRGRDMQNLDSLKCSDTALPTT